jgi:hypothetical protein
MNSDSEVVVLDLGNRAKHRGQLSLMTHRKMPYTSDSINDTLLRPPHCEVYTADPQELTEIAHHPLPTCT